MITCPRCKRKIIAKQNICSSCGYWFFDGEIEKLRNKNQKKQLALGAILMVVIVIIIYSISVSNSNSKENEPTVRISNQPGVQETTNKSIIDKEQEYVEVLISNTNIMLNPSKTSDVLAKAKQGNVFELHQEEDGFFGIFLFSGELRFVEKTKCQKILYKATVPESLQLRKTIFKKIIIAEDKAQADADKTISYKDVYENIEYTRVLMDKYKLELFNQYNLQPAAYFELIMEGVQNKW